MSVPLPFGLACLVPGKYSKLVYRAGLYSSGRTTMTQDSFHGGARSSYGISVEGKAVTHILT